MRLVITCLQLQIHIFFCDVYWISHLFLFIYLFCHNNGLEFKTIANKIYLFHWFGLCLSPGPAVAYYLFEHFR